MKKTMTLNSNPILKKQASYGAQLGVLALSFLGTLFLCTLFASALGSPTANRMLLTAAVQNLIVFCGSAIFLAWFSSNFPMRYLHVTAAPKWRWLAGMLIIYIIGIPVMNQIIWWNSEMHLPDSMSAVEKLFRAMEDQAALTSEVLLSRSTVAGLIVNVLVIGCLTGFSEELFFRGALQTTLGRAVNPHAAIWIAAFIFSLLHFQFFGFVPRLLLGAFFGYLLYWTGSIWVPAIAHAINNSIVVLSAWLIRKGVFSEEVDSLGITVEGIPWMAFGSACLLIVFFILLKNYFFPKNADNG